MGEARTGIAIGTVPSQQKFFDHVHLRWGEWVASRSLFSPNGVVHFFPSPRLVCGFSLSKQNSWEFASTLDTIFPAEFYRRMAIYPDLDGKIVVITGGAQGIGAAMVPAFHSQGAHVCFCDVQTAAARKIEKQLGVGVEFTRVDLLKPAEVQQWLAEISQKFERVDVLINNAASDPRQTLAKMSVTAWDELFARNLRAFFLTAQGAADLMPPGSAIINFSSITFHTAPAEMTAYVATKGGIIAFTRSLARELGPRGIRVNTLSPGWIMTERQKRMFVTPAVEKLIRRSQCVPELIDPEEIAEVALFLASSASRAITGQEILADRGWAHS